MIQINNSNMTDLEIIFSTAHVKELFRYFRQECLQIGLDNNLQISIEVEKRIEDRLCEYMRDWYINTVKDFDFSKIYAYYVGNNEPKF